MLFLKRRCLVRWETRFRSSLVAPYVKFSADSSTIVIENLSPLNQRFESRHARDRSGPEQILLRIQARPGQFRMAFIHRGCRAFQDVYTTTKRQLPVGRSGAP
jgi:hypothetical protein